MLATLLTVLTTPATACPTVATGSPIGVPFDTAQVALVRQGTRTTFTVSINPEGDPQDLALVLPVPELVEESDLAVLEPDVFTRLSQYSGVLTMNDAGCQSPSSTASSQSDAAAGGGSDADGDVQVEAEYSVGGYAITILSAGESEALFTWLTDHGYQLPDAVIPVLEEHIEQGMFFMAAQVDESAAGADGSFLAPLQVSYDSEQFTVPIRLAAQSSPGEQDMILYTITGKGTGEGRVGVSNYPLVDVEDTCIWGESGVDDFPAFYDTRFRPKWADAGSAAWAVEWAGGWGDCSPCSGVSLTGEDLAELGFVGEGSEHFLTRIRLRYTPATAEQDLMLYESGLFDPLVTSYADANTWNAECIPACPDSPGEIWMVENGFETGTDTTDTVVDDDDTHTDGPDGDAGPGATESDDDGRLGCAAAPAAPVSALLLLAGLAGLARRRD